MIIASEIRRRPNKSVLAAKLVGEKKGGVPSLTNGLLQVCDQSAACSTVSSTNYVPHCHAIRKISFMCGLQISRSVDDVNIAGECGDLLQESSRFFGGCSRGEEVRGQCEHHQKLQSGKNDELQTGAPLTFRASKLLMQS